MLGTARNRAGVTQARLPAGSESPALDTRTTSLSDSVSGREGATGRPLRVTGPQPSAQAKRSPSSSGYAKAKTTPTRGTSPSSRPIETALPRRPFR